MTTTTATWPTCPKHGAPLEKWYSNIGSPSQTFVWKCPICEAEAHRG